MRFREHKKLLMLEFGASKAQIYKYQKSCIYLSSN